MPGAGPRSTVTARPPVADRPSARPPPACSAVRRAMSRPRPVEPPPLAPRRRTSASGGSPGPASATSEPGPAARPGRQPHGERRPVRGVREHVAEQRVDAAPRGRRRPTATGSGPAGRSRCDRPLRVLGQHRPERDPVGDHRGRVAARHGIGRAAAGGLDDRGDRPLEGARRRPRCGRRPRPAAGASASSRSAVSGVRSRCDRSATVSRSSREQLADPLGEVVERPRPPTPTSAGRPGRRAAVEVAAGQPVRDRGQVDRSAGPAHGPAGRRPARLDRQQGRRRAAARSSQARPTPAVSSVVGDERADDRGAPGRVPHRDDDLPAAADDATDDAGGPRRRARRAGVRAAGGPDASRRPAGTR